MENYTPATGSTLVEAEQSFVDDLDKHYIGMASLVAAIAAAIGSIIYASKHIRHSECLGSRCDQEIIREQVVQEQQIERQNLETNV